MPNFISHSFLCRIAECFVWQQVNNLMSINTYFIYAVVTKIKENGENDTLMFEYQNLTDT
jgi:hypothetical protein